MDGEGSSFDGGSIRDTCSGSSPVFGRVLFGVGRSPPRSTLVRGVVGPGEVVTHQFSRDEDTILGPSGISRRCHRSSRDRDVRQLDGCGVRQQARGHGFPCPMLVGQPPSEMDGEFRRPSRCEVSSRTRQCPVESPQPSREGCRNRVVSSPSGGEVTASRLGQSVDRHLCDLPQRETAPVLLACPGSPGRLRGCVSSSLGRPGPVCVSSLSSDRSGGRPCPRVIAARDDSGRTPLAREGVVHRPVASTDPTKSRPALVGQSVSAVKGYSSALNSVLALKGRDLASSREITMLLRSFSRSVDPVELRPPPWDLALVLQSLTGAPYEPLRTCDERFLAQKTLFLLALASAKRIGELHALLYLCVSFQGLGWSFLFFRPGLRGKDSGSLFPCSSV